MSEIFARPPRATAESQRSPLRILVAEDNPVNRVATQLLLRHLGYAADVASDGREALEATRRRDYDVVLMDVQMPVMDGLEATRRLRLDRPSRRQPRIIALTASVGAEDRELCLASGMEDFLCKPLRAGDLAEALARCSVAGPSPDALSLSS